MINGNTNLILDTSLEMRSLYSLSKTHLLCAYLCAKRCIEIEKDFENENASGNEKDRFHQEDMAYASAAVISIEAFLESSINEFFRDYLDKLKESKTDEVREMVLLQNYENYLMRNETTYTKYKLAYQLLNQPFNKHDETVEDFGKLVQLRNALVHFKPKWQLEEPDYDNIYDDINILKEKFKENVFMKDTGNAFFPKKCLGAGCADWSLKVSKKFGIMFSEALSKSGLDIKLRTDIIKFFQKYPL